MLSLQEDIRLVSKYPGIAVAFVAGHDHNVRYTVDSNGIHHIVHPFPLEHDVGVREWHMNMGHVTAHDPNLPTHLHFFVLRCTGNITQPISKSKLPKTMSSSTKS